MIRRIERALTHDEFEVLTRPGRPGPWNRAAHLLGAVVTGLPGIGCIGLVLALYVNRGGLPPSSLWLLVVFAGMLALIGLWLTVLAGWHVFRIFFRPRPVAPRMDRQRAEATRATEVRVDVEATWSLQTGDDDVPTILVRSGDRYVSIHGQILDDLWSSDEPDARAWETLGAELVCVIIEGEIFSLTHSGPPIQIGSADVMEQTPRRGTPWWFRGYHELAAADLPSWLRAQVALGH